jgi:hypothetical protein
MHTTPGIDVDDLLDTITANPEHAIVHIDGRAHMVGNYPQALAYTRCRHAAAGVEMAVFFGETDYLGVRVFEHEAVSPVVTDRQRVGRERPLSLASARRC